MSFDLILESKLSGCYCLGFDTDLLRISAAAVVVTGFFVDFFAFLWTVAGLTKVGCGVICFLD